MQKKPYVLGLDMGGTNSVLGVVDARGHVLARTSIKTQAFPDINDYVNALYEEAIKIVDSVGGMDLIRGIGAGVPNGNYYTGYIQDAMNLPWQTVPFAQLLSDRFGIPCKITNDANAAAMGEMTYGAARGMKKIAKNVITTGNIRIDTARRQVFRKNERIRLTGMEFSLLELLVNNSGQAYSRNEILQHVWSYPPDHRIDTRVVDVHISRLRSKLETDPANPELILTARGIGYMFQRIS